MQIPDEYTAFYQLATGLEPYAYQRALAQNEAASAVLQAPTGSGKTHAVLLAWLHRRLTGKTGPRRLVYALPMRSLVEQTAAVARELRDNLGLEPDDLPIHMLMGGEEPTDWREHPERDQILVGTIDMLLSRALNRGYAESRFQWPVSFGLLNSDARWIFDEVQLMGPARGTSAQLDGLRSKLGAALPCETLWMSATVDAARLRTVDRPGDGDVLGLPREDREGPLAGRLEATKTVRRIDLSEASRARLEREMAKAIAESHVSGERTIAVLNTVARAQAVADSLIKILSGDPAPAVVLIHSRYRPADRAARSAELLADVDPDGPGTIVVSTQVIEAGVDVSSRVLVTETAPHSSLVQRAGRCNRSGEFDEAEVMWLDTGPPDPKRSAPYDPAELTLAREAWLGLEGHSAAPAVLEDIIVEEPPDDFALLRRRDLIDLFDTAPDLSGMDVDVSPFIREDDERNVTVFFRTLEGKTSEQLSQEPAPTREELVAIPIADARERRAWTHDHVDRSWHLAGAGLRPGETLMLDAGGGGYDALRGWDPRLRAPVHPLPSTGPSPEQYGDDNRSWTREWVCLERHLRETRDFASVLVEQLALDGPTSAAIIEAAALHDIGKGHPVFQETLVSSADEGDREHLNLELWAKSGGHFGGRHRRRFFRHELASALALSGTDGRVFADPQQRQLVTYLVGAHHGRVRLTIRPAPDEGPPADQPDARRFALGIVDGDELPAVETPVGDIPAVVLDLGPMELGAENSWSESACALRDRLGPFRLAFYEAIVRISDWRASA